VVPWMVQQELTWGPALQGETRRRQASLAAAACWARGSAGTPLSLCCGCVNPAPSPLTAAAGGMKRLLHEGVDVSALACAADPPPRLALQVTVGQDYCRLATWGPAGAQG